MSLHQLDSAGHNIANAVISPTIPPRIPKDTFFQKLSLRFVPSFCIFRPERMNDGVAARNRRNAAGEHHKNNSRRLRMLITFNQYLQKSSDQPTTSNA